MGLWTSIEQHSGETFRQSRGKEFTYTTRGNTLRPSTTNRNIPRKDFEVAAGLDQIRSVSQLQKLGLQGPSFVYAILADQRIRQQLATASPIGACEEDERGADSPEQRTAENFIIECISKRFGTSLRSENVQLSNGCTVQIDGVAADRTLLCEAWAHQGRPKTAQKHKVMADAMKLLFAATQLSTTPRLVLAFSDEKAASHFTGRSWMARTLAVFKIGVEVVELPAQLRTELVQAQRRQANNNRPK